MEETKPNVPTPPQGLRKMPPPPPKPQAVESNNAQTKVETPEVKQEPKAPTVGEKEPTLSSLVGESNEVVKSEPEKKEKPKKEKKAKSGFLYWSGFFLSLGLIAFCIYMLIK